MGRQRQRREPKQLLPPQGRLCSAFRPGFSPGGALELPVCGRQWKQHHPDAGTEGRSCQVAGRGRKRPHGESAITDGWMNLQQDGQASNILLGYLFVPSISLPHNGQVDYNNHFCKQISHREQALNKSQVALNMLSAFSTSISHTRTTVKWWGKYTQASKRMNILAIILLALIFEYRIQLGKEVFSLSSY